MKESQPKSPKLSAIDRLTELKSIPFIQAQNFTKANRGLGQIRQLVLHATDGGETAGRARNCADWMAGKLAPKFPPPRASAHYVVDDQTVIQMVKISDLAWHAPGCNASSIGIELVGRADQTKEQWNDAFSVSVMSIAASLFARLCKALNISPVLLIGDQLQAGASGIVTHKLVADTFKRSTHQDPGPAFPLTWFIGEVQNAMSRQRGGL